MSRGEKMNLFEVMLFNCILIVFPLMLYIFYTIYATTLNFKKNNLFLDCALFSSCYLLIKYGILEFNEIPLLIFDIPLLMAYFKQKKISMAILSVAIIFYYYKIFDINLFICIIEYLSYFIIYLFSKKNKWNANIFINIYLITKMIMFAICIILSPNYNLTENNYSDFLLLMLIFYILSNFILYLYNKTNEIISLYTELKALEKEEQVKKSLFKITHEIKNPIAVCKGYLDMFDVNNLEHSRKYVPIIKSEINRVLILLHDFLSITKIKIEKEEMDLNLLLEDTVNCLEPIFENNKIHFLSDISKDELYIHADYNRLKQTLVNLIKNSKESISEEGTVKLFTTMDAKKIKIYIEDNGVGMSKEELDKIKQAFFTTKQTGTGLGVFLANEIITAHQGTLDYLSEKNKGTRVVITLPIT